MPEIIFLGYDTNRGYMYSYDGHTIDLSYSTAVIDGGYAITGNDSSDALYKAQNYISPMTVDADRTQSVVDAAPLNEFEGLSTDALQETIAKAGMSTSQLQDFYAADKAAKAEYISANTYQLPDNVMVVGNISPVNLAKGLIYLPIIILIGLIYWMVKK